MTLLMNSPSRQLPSFIAEQLFMRRRRDPVDEAEERVFLASVLMGHWASSEITSGWR